MIDKLPSPKTNSKKMRIGRGTGSGKGGHTATRGMKGQKSRSGYSAPRKGFEGGQMPLSRRLPTLRGQSSKSRGRGFVTTKFNKFALKLSEVASAIKGDKVNLQSLEEAGLITRQSKKAQVKVLFDKEIDKKLVFEGIPVSESAKKAIEKAGGKLA